MKQAGKTPVLTIGHSTRPLEKFIDLLEAHEITTLVDVRTVPRSRHNPQFNTDTLRDALAQHGIGYTHVPGLGGFRRAREDSPNIGWRNASFRGYADYMQTPEFAQQLARVTELATQQRLALMCAEAVPWRCHRSLIADALIVRGIPVEEIISKTRREAHALSSFAQVNGTLISYPALGATAKGKAKKPSAD